MLPKVGDVNEQVLQHGSLTLVQQVVLWALIVAPVSYFVYDTYDTGLLTSTETKTSICHFDFDLYRKMSRKNVSHAAKRGELLLLAGDAWHFHCFFALLLCTAVSMTRILHEYALG